MLTILANCSPLQGIDYISAEGSQGFDDLCHVVNRLEECGKLRRDVAEHCISCLKNGKQYLKSDYGIKLASLFPPYNVHNVHNVYYQICCDNEQSRVP